MACCIAPALLQRLDTQVDVHGDRHPAAETTGGWDEADDNLYLSPPEARCTTLDEAYVSTRFAVCGMQRFGSAASRTVWVPSDD
jgi:hypothetical protein